jgi:hypothetical protein
MLSGLAWAALPDLRDDMGKAAPAWLSLLDGGQLLRARPAWSDPLRNPWHYVPAADRASALRQMRCVASDAGV